MTKAGAAPPQFSGELERALGSRVDRPPTFPALDGHSRAADVLRAHLADQTAAMLARDGAARHDEPDGVHKMRVATRRLRSALATFRPLVDRGVTDPIRDELKWIAAVLGGARDAEVLRERLLAELSTEPDDLVLGPISTLIEAELRAAHRAAHDRLVAGLISPRYYRLLDRLDALVADPPFTPLADGPADTVVTKLVRGSFKRLRRLVKAEAPEAATERERDHRYHEIRKAAKRLRYAVEAVEPAFGAGAHRLATAAENIQEVLGEHQDSVVARQALRELGVRIHLDGENAFTIARLHALEQTRADDSAAEFASAWAAASDKRLRRWLTG
jgi:CHAD domain-containing protein